MVSVTLSQFQATTIIKMPNVVVIETCSQSHEFLLLKVKLRAADKRSIIF